MGEGGEYFSVGYGHDGSGMSAGNLIIVVMPV